MTDLKDVIWRIREKFPVDHAELLDLADRIEALTAENERLREALTQIARLRTDLRGDFSLGSKQSDIARAALGDTQ